MVSAYSVLICLLFTGGTIALSLGTYWLTRKLLSSSEYERHKEMAGSMVVRIGALQGLILALVFAHEMSSYQRLNDVLGAETAAVADVFHDANRYGGDAAPLKALMIDYLDTVVTQEWPRKGAGGILAAGPWIAWENAYLATLDLVPKNPRESALRDHILTQLHAIAQARDDRQPAGDSVVFQLFWLAAIAGVMMISAGYYIYPPERQNMVLMSLFSGYTGVVLFMIFAFSNPFHQPAALQPAPLEHLLLSLRQIA